MIKKEMNGCLIYTRVSSDEQISNFSLDSQEEICTNYALQHDYKIIKVFREEGVSAKTLARPKLLELLDYSRKNKKDIVSVVGYRIDRFARETSDYLAVRKKLLESGIKLESATEPTGDSPTEKFIETILAASAELDNSIRAEKARIGLKKRFEAGLTCRPPLGYIPNKENSKLGSLIDPESFDKVKDAWELIGTGTKSLAEVAEIMNEWGLRTVWRKKKKLLTKQYCCKLFKNPFYYGCIRSKKYGKEVVGQHKAMITEELYYRVQGILAGRRTLPLDTRHVKNNTLFPLRGLVKHTCGQALVAGNVKGRHKHYPLYWCPRCKGAGSISSEKMEEKLLQSLRKLQPSQGAINIFTMALRIDYDKVLKNLNRTKKLAEKKQLELKQMMIALVEGHLKGIYSDDIYNEQKIKIEDQLLTVGISKNESIIDQYSIEGIIAFTKALWFDLGKAYLASDYSQRRILIGSIYPSGLTYDKGQLLNRKVSPIVRLVKDISYDSGAFVTLSAEDDSYFEPLSDNYLVHFTRLMEVYQSKSEEDLHD